MFLRIAFGIFLGLLTTLFTVQSDPWIQKKVGVVFQTLLSETLKCDVSCRVEFFDVIHPRLYLKNLSMRDRNNEWEWHAQSYRSGFSWIDVIKQRCISVWAHAKKVRAHSKLKNGTPAITPHIQELIKGPDLPIPLFITQAKFRDAQCLMDDDSITATTRWHCDAQKDGALFRLTFCVLDGDLSTHSVSYLSHLKGTIKVTTKEKNKEIEFSAQLDLNGSLPQLGEYPTCFFSGNWHKNRGRFQLQSIDQTLRIHPLIIGDKGDDLHVEATASVPIELLYKLALQREKSPVSGICAVRFKGSLADEGHSEGMVICEEVQHSSLSRPTVCSITFSKRAQQWDGAWTFRHGVHQAVHGSFDWHAGNKKAQFFAENESTLPAPYFSHYLLNPHDAQLRCVYDGNNHTMDGTYTVRATHATRNNSFASTGHCVLDQKKAFYANGSIGAYRYECIGSLAHAFLSHLQICDKDNHSMLDVTYDTERKKYYSTVDFSMVHALCDTFFQYDLHGQGTLCADAYRKNDLFHVDLTLEDATIQLPQTYNFMSGAGVHIAVDLKKRQLAFDDLTCSFHNGIIKSKRGIVWLDESGALQFAHVPFLIDRCLVTAHKDLFAVLSGNLLFSKKEKNPACVSGNLMINRAQLKENLFSQQLQKKLFSSAFASHAQKVIPVECDITIETKDPIRVDTPFLQANAQVGVHVKGNVTDPIVEGSVLVPSGSIRFPYQPLHISKGELSLSPDQPRNPNIELIAKNSIKNHLITLHLTGSLQDTTILLESTPPLSNEQIVGLLIAGAHEDSLDSLIPALLMQNVTNYIFSSHSSNFYDRFIKPWMQQINVSLKPNFSDQSGRGGLRGTLEIVVNDRWRALIEKNFSLTEDTRFELEYILSDDITFRILRDERRDIGGEVEMRWKF